MDRGCGRRIEAVGVLIQEMVVIIKIRPPSDYKLLGTIKELPGKLTMPTIEIVPEEKRPDDSVCNLLWVGPNCSSRWIRHNAPKASAGPHKARECLSLVLILRSRLKYVLTYR
ncbi:hypothetical protein CTI12_AA468050 [Artemisia annua]|uniref:Uncharacterized protein n=1 Tax=Artemisia annua TaxID=35608 RepID=A0A2U1LPJ8_ARTAN|nr:hypothetical protein CTI12_AA468050 [Artemisia annua]